MPKVSQYSLEEERTKELVGQLWDAFALLESRKEVVRFLSKFFSPTEIEMFAKRLELLKLADTDLEVSDLIKFTGVSKVTVYDWLEKHDSFEANYHIVIDRLKELDRSRTAKQKAKRDARYKVPKRTSVGGELLKVGAAVAYKGYKKRKKRRSVLKEK